MLKECQQGDKKDDKEDREQFANAVKSKGERFAAESLFIALILRQQRMINKGGGQTVFYAEGQGVLMIKMALKLQLGQDKVYLISTVRKE
jgi:hypothetical protein